VRSGGSPPDDLEWAAMLPALPRGASRRCRPGAGRRGGRFAATASTLAALILLPAAHGVAQTEGRAPWPMVGRDAAHTGAAEGPSPPYRRAWTRAIGLGGPVAGPVVAEAAVVVVAARGVVGLHPDDGTVLWQVERTPGPAGPPAVAGDLVVHASGDGAGSALVGRAMEDGREAWRTFTDSAVAGGLAVAQGVVYAGTREGVVLALDAATGEERWRFEAQGAVETAPAVAGELLVAASEELRTGRLTIQAVDALGGSEDPAWRFTPPGPPAAPAGAPASDGRRVFVAMSDGTIRALGLEDGQESWSAAARAVVSPSQVPAAADDLLVADRLYLYRLDLGTGEERWVFQLADLRPLSGGRANSLRASSPAVTGDTVLIGDGSGLLSAVDLASGRRVWRADIGAGPIGAVALSEAAVFVSSQGEGGGVVALEHDPEGLLLDEVSPTVLFPLRALLNFAIAFVVVGLAILGLFRIALRSRRRPASSEAEDGP
jgi:outer membrane protein assembly factor BamB